MLKNLKHVNFKSRRQQSKEKNQHLTLGILIGAAIGTMAGIFSQTERGKTATKKVVNTAKDFSEKSKGVVCDSINKIKKAKQARDSQKKIDIHEDKEFSDVGT
jgi:gas vesicle protein